eukprot:3687436-Alexandrium_andersonii.AAC.1
MIRGLGGLVGVPTHEYSMGTLRGLGKRPERRTPEARRFARRLRSSDPQEGGLRISGDSEPRGG